MYDVKLRLLHMQQGSGACRQAVHVACCLPMLWVPMFAVGIGAGMYITPSLRMGQSLFMTTGVGLITDGVQGSLDSYTWNMLSTSAARGP